MTPEYMVYAGPDRVSAAISTRIVTFVVAAGRLWEPARLQRISLVKP
jgi:hypothetical protein